MDKLRVGMKDM